MESNKIIPKRRIWLYPEDIMTINNVSRSSAYEIIKKIKFEFDIADTVKSKVPTNKFIQYTGLTHEEIDFALQNDNWQ
ncbi:MAG: hypothetical protein MUF58_20285 [Arcicella sp.]|jgi:hypothetical protein|nr:hypothetical protein [Arcicella sp.]